MTEATQRERSCWQIYILLIAAIFMCNARVKAQQIKPRIELAQLIDRAEILKLRREFDGAIEICNKVILDAKVLEDWESQSRALNEMSDIHRNIGQLEQAKNYIKASENLIAKHSLENTIEAARNTFYKGKLLRSKYIYSLEDVKDSVLNYHSAAKRRYESLGKSSINFQADMLLEFAYIRMEIGNTDVAKKYYGDLNTLLNTDFEKLDYRRGLYFLFIGTYYFSIGDYERSTILSQIASYIMRFGDENDQRRYFDCEMQIANNYYGSLHFLKAAEQYKKIIKLAEKEYGTGYSKLVDFYNNLSQALIFLGDYDKAIEYSFQAIKKADENPDSGVGLYYSYNNLAEAYGKKGDHKNAITNFEKTIDERLKLFGPNQPEVYEGYRYFGEYYERQHLYAEALQYYQKSLSALFEDFKPTSIYHNPDFHEYSNTEQLLYVLFDKSGSLYKLYNQTNNLEDLKSSYNLYVTVYELLDKLLNSSFLDQSSMQIFQSFEEGFNLSIDCAVQLFELTSDEVYSEQAFRFMEKNKYILLQKALLISQSNTEKNATNSKFEEKKIAMEIDKLMQSINGRSNADSIFVLQNKLISALDERDAMGSENAAEDKVEISTENVALKLKEAQLFVTKSDELLIEYHWSNNHIYAFIIGKDFTNIVKIEKSAELLSSIRKMASSLSSHSTLKDDFVTYTTSAFYLYNKLVKPMEILASSYNSENEIRRLIIVPDGPLSTIPFEAFITKLDTISNSYWGLKYLCEKHTISYAYSLNILKSNLSDQNESDELGLLALSYSGKFDESNDMDQWRSENELPYSGEEIRRIGKYIKSTNYLGNDATEEIFKSKAGDYSILHLALHGQADTTDMFNSRLIFKRDSASKEDGELRAFELYNLDLRKLQMVVLSACETGIGKQNEGEGIFSIARGFAFAGCPSIVMSLWKVNDKSTADLIDYFYSNLKDGLPKDEALRNAKLTYLEKSDDINAHPSNWASFIILGNMQPLELATETFRWYYLMVLGGIMLIIWLIIRRRESVKF